MGALLQMEPLRDEIDSIDKQIIELLSKRFKISEKIASIKKEKNLPLLDPTREKHILEKIKSKDPIIQEELREVYRAIFAESKKVQRLKQHPDCPFKRIQIIGLGLIGGSIAKALPFPLTNNQPELLIVSTPLETIVSIAKTIDSKSPLIIMDVGSVKQNITEAFEKLTHDNLEFVATHPFAGKETAGYENSSPTLFVNAPWAITPHSKNKKETLDQIGHFIEFLGANPVIIDKEEHDREAALISHLPGILSRLFYEFAKSESGIDLKLAGPGFQSFTRLAKDNPELHRAIETLNHDTIVKLLEKWIEILHKEVI